MGLLKVTITGIGEGASPTATAEWVAGASSGVNGQAATVVPVDGSNALNDVQLIRRLVAFEDDDIAGKRFVRATFDLINRTTINFANFTLYAVNVNANIGGTAIVAMTAGTGTPITDPGIARGFKPTHGMRPSFSALEVHPTIANLQFFTPSEVDNPFFSSGIKQQAVALGILPNSATVLEYGFVATNYSGGRTISARNTGADCTVNACKGAVTLAYQFPKVNPRNANPFSFSLYFVVANETVQFGSQSVEEQSANTVMGLSSPTGFSGLRTLAGSNFFSHDAQTPLCRVKYAIRPDLFLGPDPIPTGPPGSLDVCFGAGGKRATDIGSGIDEATSLAIQSDGKIVVAGISVFGSFISYDIALVRYNSNGSLDTSFGTGGKVTTDLGSSFNQANSLAIQSDGKIVVAGFSNPGSNPDFALVRYNPNGSLDTSFDGDGKVTTPIGSSTDIATSLAIQSDGKIVVAGRSDNSNPDFALVRYNPNGSLDTSFDGDGKVTTAIGSGHDQASSLALQSDGKIVVAGISVNASFNDDFALVRYNPNGSLDTSFDGDGKVTTAIGSGHDQANSLAIQSDGKIVVAGHSFIGSTYDFALVRYNPNGSLDTSLNGDGKVTTAIGPSLDQASSLALQSDGKIVVAGVGNSDFALARYNP